MEPRALKRDHLPTPSEELWKYTNLARALPQGLVDMPEAPEILIHKNGGQACGYLEDIVFTGRDGEHQKPRLKIVLGEGADLTLVERHNGAGAYWKNMVTTVTLARGARLRHVRLQEDAPDSLHTNNVHITLAENAVYDGFLLGTGAKLSRCDIQAEISGKNAECAFTGLNLLKGAQHGDTTLLVAHKAPHGISRQFMRTILDDTARGVFQGKVYVSQGARKTQASQLSNALLLSAGAEMDTKPEMEIYEGDVQCSHGATTGQLNEEPLFYLRSRGLTENEARLLLVQAFVGEAVDKIENEAVRAEIQRKTETWIRSVLGT